MTRSGILAPSLAAVSLAAMVLALPPSTQAVLVGSEFQVNTYTTGYQYEPAVAGSPTGSFVVVWQSYPQLEAPAGSDIFGQRFGADGAPAGGEFQVNGLTAGYQYYPHVAMRDNGDFVVVWTNGEGDGDGPGISGRRFNATGQPLGPEFRVNSATAGYQYDARVALDASGNMTVVWWTAPSGAAPQPDGDNAGVFARRFDASGNAIAGQFQVNQLTTGDQSFPDVRFDANGNFVVAWQSKIGTEVDVAVRRFSGTATALGNDFVIAREGSDIYPRVSTADDGGFVVVWQNGGVLDGLDGSLAGVFAERFNSSGTTAGPVFQVNTYTTDAQVYPAVAAGRSGSYLVVWESHGQFSSASDIVAQAYTSSAPLGGEIQVDSYASSEQSAAEIARIGEDKYVVVWESLGQDGDTDGVFGRFMTGGFPTGQCGNADGKGNITATDALLVLRTATGVSSCAACLCDVNGVGGVTATDALSVLRVSVGVPLEFRCPACG